MLQMLRGQFSVRLIYRMLQEPHVQALAQQIQWRIDHVLLAPGKSSVVPKDLIEPAKRPALRDA